MTNGADPVFTKCGFYSNRADTGGAVSLQQWMAGVSILEARFDQCHFDANPLFVGVEYNNYQLEAGSPCIDAGLNVAPLPDEDMFGNERILDSDGDGLQVVDMGIWERELPSVVHVDDDWTGTTVPLKFTIPRVRLRPPIPISKAGIPAPET